MLNKCPVLQDTSKFYTSEEVKTEMLNTIKATIEEAIDNRLSKICKLCVNHSVLESYS